MFERISKEILEYNTGQSYEVNDFDFDHLITCNYYNTEEFLKCEFKTSNSFSILPYSFYPIT